MIPDADALLRVVRIRLPVVSSRVITYSLCRSIFGKLSGLQLSRLLKFSRSATGSCAETVATDNINPINTAFRKDLFIQRISPLLRTRSVAENISCSLSIAGLLGSEPIQVVRLSFSLRFSIQIFARITVGISTTIRFSVSEG